MFRVITANLNGIRSAAKKGFFDWFGEQEADVVCVQEIKCSQDDMTPEFLAPHGFTGYFQHAVKKGYSGAGVYTRHEPDEVVIGFGSEEFDPEGRYVEARFGKLSVVSVYVPSGSSGDDRQQAKYRFMDEFMPHLAELAKEREVILCGDVNIVHKEIDIKNWKSNQKNSGCLPEEREWLTQAVRRSRLRRRVPHARSASRAIYVVEQSRPGLCEERRVADRLSDRNAGRCGNGEVDVACSAISSSATMRR